MTRSRFVLFIAGFFTVQFFVDQQDLTRTACQSGAGDGPGTDARQPYVPGVAEEAVLQLSDALGFGSHNNPDTCFIWDGGNNSTPSDFRAKFAGYVEGLERHAEAIRNFSAIPSLIASIKRGGGDRDVCDTTRIHPGGVAGLFPPGQLSLSSSGYVEPLLPPMRHPKICWDRSLLTSIDYLVHDFEAMCHKLKPHSKLVFVDMGANFNRGGGRAVLRLLDVYERLGFVFDNIYAFERDFAEPGVLYGKLLPEKYMHSYHWINVGITHEEASKLNPLHSIIKKFEEDDFVVVKLDIDTPFIELPLAQQLLDHDIYSKLIDQFYFEHHVHLGELKVNWKGTMAGSVKESLELFSKLREKGIPAHFWT